MLPWLRHGDGCHWGTRTDEHKQDRSDVWKIPVLRERLFRLRKTIFHCRYKLRNPLEPRTSQRKVVQGKATQKQTSAFRSLVCPHKRIWTWVFSRLCRAHQIRTFDGPEWGCFCDLFGTIGYRNTESPVFDSPHHSKGKL